MLTVSLFLPNNVQAYLYECLKFREKKIPFVLEKLSLQTSWGFPVSIHFKIAPLILQRRLKRKKEAKKQFISFYTPTHKKWRGIMLYPPNCFECLPVRASFPDSNLSSFWPIFFKLCMDIDIGEKWCRITNGLNSFITNKVMALDWCKHVFFLNIFRTNRWILIKFCRWIDIYKIHVVSKAR